MLDEDNDFYNFLEQSSLATKFKAEDMTECIGNIILTNQFFFFDNSVFIQKWWTNTLGFGYLFPPFRLVIVGQATNLPKTHN